jgi:prevent-host-death family protein
MKTMSASEARRKFSKLLRDVAAGEDVGNVSHGRTVARIVSTADEAKTRQMARSALLERLSHQEASGLRDWKRADITA